MTNCTRLVAVALLLALTACGNKGPLVRPSSPVPEDTTPAPASPPSTDPTDALPQENPAPPADTGTPTPPVPTPPVPTPPADDGDGNG